MSVTYHKPSLTADAALKVMAPCRAKAGDGGGFRDRRPRRVRSHEGDARAGPGALVSTPVAVDEAYTAAGFGISTAGWFDFIKDDEPLRLAAANGHRPPGAAASAGTAADTVDDVETIRLDETRARIHAAMTSIAA